MSELLFHSPSEEWMYQHVAVALDRFESERRSYLDYVYVEYHTEEILVIVFSKDGRENQYFMVCIYGNTEENLVRSEQDYFEKICQNLSISPYEQLSYHSIIGERGEGDRYRDSAYEIVTTIFSTEDS